MAACTELMYSITGIHCRNYSMTLTAIVVTLINCVNFTAALLTVAAMTLPVSCDRRSTRRVGDGRLCHDVSAVHRDVQCRHVLLLLILTVVMATHRVRTRAGQKECLQNWNLQWTPHLHISWLQRQLSTLLRVTILPALTAWSVDPFCHCKIPQVKQE